MNIKPIIRKNIKFCFSNLTNYNSTINPLKFYKQYKFSSIQRKFISDSKIAEMFERVKDSQIDVESEINPVTNFLYSEIKKFEDKTFNLNDFILGMRSLENVTITFTELQQYITRISLLLESLVSLIQSSNILTKENIDIFLPQTVKIYFIYGINSPHNWSQIHSISTEFINDLSKLFENKF